MLPEAPALTRASTTDALLGVWLDEGGFRGCAIPKILRSLLSNFIFCTRMLNPFLPERFVSLRLFWGLLAAVGGDHSDTQSLLLVLSILVSREFE